MKKDKAWVVGGKVRLENVGIPNKKLKNGKCYVTFTAHEDERSYYVPGKRNQSKLSREAGETVPLWSWSAKQTVGECAGFTQSKICREGSKHTSQARGSD